MGHDWRCWSSSGSPIRPLKTLYRPQKTPSEPWEMALQTGSAKRGKEKCWLGLTAWNVKVVSHSWYLWTTQIKASQRGGRKPALIENLQRQNLSTEMVRESKPKKTKSPCPSPSANISWHSLLQKKSGNKRAEKFSTFFQRSSVISNYINKYWLLTRLVIGPEAKMSTNGMSECSKSSEKTEIEVAMAEPVFLVLK